MRELVDVERLIEPGRAHGAVGQVDHDARGRVVERTGFGPFLFDEWRKDPDFVLNDERYRGASILITGANFGSGSSREHAPWALEDYGFRAVIAPSFADIFRNNCFKIGLLPVELRAESVRALMDAVLDDPATRIVVDLPNRVVRAPGLDETFDIDEFTHWRLTDGLVPRGERPPRAGRHGERSDAGLIAGRWPCHLGGESHELSPPMASDQ